MIEISIHLDRTPVKAANAHQSDYARQPFIEITLRDNSTVTIWGGEDDLERFEAIADLLSGRKVVTPMPMDGVSTHPDAVLLTEVRR